MKLSEKLLPSQLTMPTWDLYDQCSEAIGVILDNKFRDPHITVYEHIRHTPSEVFRHIETAGAKPPLAPLSDTVLAKEEQELLGTLLTPEVGRRLNIVGDVGVGKTTFIKHITEVHLKTSDYCGTLPIYIDFADFNASLDNPITEIRRKFVDTVWAKLEQLFGLEELKAVDDTVFESSEIFSTSRSLAYRLPEKEREIFVVKEMQKALEADSVRFTIERVNALSKGDPNRLLFIADNIDHLPEQVLRVLTSFLLQVQVSATPMLVVCMRDHTYLASFSSYREDKTVPAWGIRLKPPNLRMMLDRRIAHFFPTEAEKKVSMSAGSLKVDLSTSKVCRALLRSPFNDQAAYEFICNYTNYNLRDLFLNLQHIVGFAGYASHVREFFLHEEPILRIGVDECLISLALRESLMYFPQRSPIFNPYSAGQNTTPLDKLVACRILQFLDKSITWIPFSELRSRLIDWGYSSAGIDGQVRAMIDKDIIWTSTGAPINFDERSDIRLSYRGQLYARNIVRRSVFNYMMSFDVEAPSETHAIFRHHNEKGEFTAELESFANFARTFESEALALRVIGLAEILFEAESTEVRQLLKNKDMANFKLTIAPRSISLDVMDGLVKFLKKTQEVHGNGWRFIPASTATLKLVGETSSKYRHAFSSVFERSE